MENTLFVPTITQADSWLKHMSCGSSYVVKELTPEENAELDLRYTWNGGTSYSWKWNRNSPNAWVIDYCFELLPSKH
jgi:hypothetical protein